MVRMNNRQKSWLIKFLPYYRYKITTKMQKSEIIEIMREITYIYGEEGQNKKIYVGSIEDSKFTIKKLIYYRSSALPIIDGEICEEGEFRVIDLKIRINFFTAIFFFLIILLLIVATMGAIYRWIIGGMGKAGYAYSIMLLLVFSVVPFAFRASAGKCKE
ncbi:MAG: hypothetical protein AB1Z23_12300 [Eubacteriales bacterium]